MRYLGCFVQRPGLDTRELAGLGWINSIKKNGKDSLAEVAEGFFKEYQREHMPERFMALMTDYCFDKWGFSVVYGVTPKPNRAANFIARRLGYTAVGPLPKFVGWEGEAVEATIYHMTRERWRERNAIQKPI